LSLVVRFLRYSDLNEGKWRSRSPSTSSTIQVPTEQGYGSSILWTIISAPTRRIEAICKGINDNGINIQWGCEGRVDSVAHICSAIGQSPLRTLMFGMRAAAKKFSMRQKEQTLEGLRRGDMEKKPESKCPCFFVVATRMKRRRHESTFEFCAKLPLDTLASTTLRLSATPLSRVLNRV